MSESVLDHFRHEEDGGYFREAIEIAPRLSERADGLLAQHPQMASQLVALQEHASKNDSSEKWWQPLNDMFDRFLHHFYEDVVAEYELLYDAYNVDIGAED